MHRAPLQNSDNSVFLLGHGSRRNVRNVKEGRDGTEIDLHESEFQQTAQNENALRHCNLSFASCINIPQAYEFREEKAAALYRHVDANLDKYSTFMNSLRCNHPELTVRESEQRTTSVSVGVLRGEIDAICGRAIVEIKAKSSEDFDGVSKANFCLCVYASFEFW